jgi:hypothetical protein
MGQVLRKQLPVRRRNDGIVPAGKNEHGGLDAWQKRLQTRKVRRFCFDIDPYGELAERDAAYQAD